MKIPGQVSHLTSSRAVGDGKHLPSKFLSLYFLNELASFSYEALNTSILSVSHTDFPSVRKERQAVWDLERYASPPVRRTFSQE